MGYGVCLHDCVCVLTDLTWLPLLGGGRKSWYNIILLLLLLYILLREYSNSQPSYWYDLLIYVFFFLQSNNFNQICWSFLCTRSGRGVCILSWLFPSCVHDPVVVSAYSLDCSLPVYTIWSWCLHTLLIVPFLCTRSGRGVCILSWLFPFCAYQL